MQLYVYYIWKIFIDFFFYRFQVCIILNNFFINIYSIGALTSKPFAYKAWSWELTSSYIVDLSTCFNSKIRIDLKGLEIVWVLPWLNNSFSENWISDKTRFFYDGLSLNRVTKFFFRKKNFIQFLINFLLIFSDPIFQKYIFENNLFDNLILLSKFKNTKENFYDFYISFFNINNLFYVFFSYYKLSMHTTKYFKNSYFFFDKKIYFSYTLIKNEFFISLINKFFYQRRVTINNKNFKFYLNQLEKIDSLGIKKIPGLFFSKFFNLKLKNNLNLYINMNLDLLVTSLLKFLNFQKKISILGLNSNLIKNFLLKNKFKFFNLNILQNNNIIILINTNLRILNPTLHLYLRWLVLTNHLLIINFGNNILNFKHLNLGSKIGTFFMFLKGLSWLSAIYIKNYSYSFLINFDTSKFIVSNLNRNFFFKNFTYFANLNIWKKIYFFLQPKFFFISNYNYINIISDLSFFLKKKTLVKSLHCYKALHNTFSKIYIYNNITCNESIFTYTNIFSKNFFNLKKNFFFLFETNIVNWKIESFWDFIFPVSTVTENFFLIKNYFARPTKSLFIKFGPWFSWSFFNYLKFIYLFSTYPFLWESTTVLRYLNITLLLLNFWLNGSFFIDFLFKRLINKKKIKFSSLKKSNFSSLKKSNFFSSFKLFYAISLNPWFSSVSYIKSSKYVSLGFNLLKKEKKTIF